MPCDRLLCRMHLFDKVDGKVTPGKGRKRILDFYLKSATYPEIKSFKVDGSTLLPPEVRCCHSFANVCLLSRIDFAEIVGPLWVPCCT